MREWDAPEQVNNSSVILMKTWLIFVVILSTLAAAKLMPKKNSGLNGIHIHDLCDIGAVHCKTESSSQLEAGYVVYIPAMMNRVFCTPLWCLTNPNHALYTHLFLCDGRRSKSYYQSIPNYNKFSNLIGYISMPYLRMYWPVKSFAFEFVIGS